MRKTIYALLRSLIPNTIPIVSAASLDKVPSARPFAVLRTVLESPESGTQTRGIEVWFHDVYGSYVKIDETISALRKVMDASLPFADNSGIVAVMELQNVSPDLTDDVLKTVCRMVAYKVVGVEKSA